MTTDNQTVPNKKEVSRSDAISSRCEIRSANEQNQSDIFYFTYDSWIVFKRYPTKDPCAICCGAIPTNTSVDRVFPHEEPDLPLVLTFRNSGMNEMDWN
jgi:hypothetical protein